jgi:hypothetical protein
MTVGDGDTTTVKLIQFVELGLSRELAFPASSCLRALPSSILPLRSGVPDRGQENLAERHP